MTGEMRMLALKAMVLSNKDPRVALTTEGVTEPNRRLDMNYFSAFTPSPLYSHKENYLRYLDSRQGQDVKRSYWLSNRPNECWACGKKYDYKSQGFNFHHLTYKNLYREKPCRCTWMACQKSTRFLCSVITAINWF